MKLNAKQLRHIINEVAGDENNQHYLQIQKLTSDMQRSLMALLNDLPDEGLNSDIYVALDELEQALLNVKDVLRVVSN